IFRFGPLSAECSSSALKKKPLLNMIRRGFENLTLSFPPLQGVGISTSVPYIGTGCCGFEGPLPPPLWIRCPARKVNYMSRRRGSRTRWARGRRVGKREVVDLANAQALLPV